METKQEYERSEIVDFFQNSTILLTGGLGFIGKTIMYKLFSTCEVSCVYLLVRKKASKSGTQRLRELLQDQVFVHLRIKIPDLANRIKLIEGDCSLQDLGLSASDEETLCQSVNFVIHGAAAMNMMGLSKKSVEINVRGTLQLVHLAQKMVNLKAFVYLSALGAFLEREEIEEKLYKSHLEYEDLLYLLKIDKALPMDKHDRKRILGNKLTMYGMTKAAAENIFLREKLSVPVVIFRFPLTIACAKEPTAGWTDGFYGPNGIFVLPILGLYPASYWENDITFDFAPADLVVNSLLAVIRHSYTQFQEIKEETELTPFVYNYSTNYQKNTIPFKSLMSYMKNKLGSNLSRHRFYSNKLRFQIYSGEFGYIPALVIDSIGLIFGKKYRFFKTYDSLVESNYQLAKASVIASHVVSNNVQNCWNNLNDVDKKLFSFEMNEVVWDEYLALFANSVRESARTLVETNPKLKSTVYWIPRIQIAFKLLQLLVVSCTVYCIATRWF